MPKDYTELLNKTMKDIGVNHWKSSSIMREMALYSVSRGDNDKAMTFITRSIKMAEDVLEGEKIHRKYLSLIRVKADILKKNKKYTEALDERNNALNMVEQIMGNTDNDWYYALLIKKGYFYESIKSEISKVLEYLE